MDLWRLKNSILSTCSSTFSLQKNLIWTLHLWQTHTRQYLNKPPEHNWSPAASSPSLLTSVNDFLNHDHRAQTIPTPYLLEHLALSGLSPASGTTACLQLPISNPLLSPQALGSLSHTGTGPFFAGRSVINFPDCILCSQSTSREQPHNHLQAHSNEGFFPLCPKLRTTELTKLAVKEPQHLQAKDWQKAPASSGKGPWHPSQLPLATLLWPSGSPCHHLHLGQSLLSSGISRLPQQPLGWGDLGRVGRGTAMVLLPTKVALSGLQGEQSQEGLCGGLRS